MGKNDISNDRIYIALGGLLHDVGKFLQRAKREKFLFEDEDLNKYLNAWNEQLEDIYKYEHAYFTSVFIKFLEKGGLIDSKEAEKLINWGARHHNPTDELESVVCQIADWYSSSERETKIRSDINLLHSVFERISLEPAEHKKSLFEYAPSMIEDLHEDQRRSFGFYSLKELSTAKEVFPVVFSGGFVRENGSYIIKSLGSIPKAVNDYGTLFGKFLKEIKALHNIRDKSEQFLNAIYYIFYKYTWCVPAATYDIEAGNKHYPAISLFDHSRVLSAIALSIYDWAIDKGVEVSSIKPKGTQLLTDEEEIFLLVEGDIGGIQKFIFNIHKSSESELSIAKALRGRSFFLTMLPEVLARYILSKLEYPITNALFIGGGKFQLLIGNTEKNLKKLKEIEDNINKWLFEAFHGELSISIATVKMKGDVFRNIKKEGKETFLDKVEQLQLKLDRKKKRRFRELIWDGKFLKDAVKAESICNSCRSLPVFKENLCEWCYNSQKWGEIIPKIKYVAFDFEHRNIDLDPQQIMNLREFGKVYLLEDEDLSKVKYLPEILNIEDTELKIETNKVVNGFKFIGHSAPKVVKETSNDLLNFLNNKLESKRGRKLKDDEKLGRNHILPFDLLVEFAEGDKKLGFFRADVDYLGLILSDGLRYNEFGTEEIYTISRIATLSRMLDLFFAGYLNKLAEEVSLYYVKNAIENYKQRAEKLSASEKERKELLEKIYDEKEKKKKLKVCSLIYTVYSGGDDLFIIAPYDLAIEFALRLREEFRKFTCENPEFGISGGIYIGRHDTPIHLVAKFTEALEGKAKSQRLAKDMVALFDKPLMWSEEVECFVERKGVMSCVRENKEDPCRKQNRVHSYIFLETVYKDIVSKMINWLRKENTGVSRGLYYKLLQLYKNYVDGNRIDPHIYPKIYYYVGRNVKDENVRKELIDTLLNGMGGSLRVEAVISNLDVILSLVLMKTRGGR